MTSIITAWKDVSRKQTVMRSVSEIYYYAAHSTDVAERRFWINELLDRLDKADEEE